MTLKHEVRSEEMELLGYIECDDEIVGKLRQVHLEGRSEPIMLYVTHTSFPEISSPFYMVSYDDMDDVIYCDNFRNEDGTKNDLSDLEVGGTYNIEITAEPGSRILYGDPHPGMVRGCAFTGRWPSAYITEPKTYQPERYLKGDNAPSQHEYYNCVLTDERLQQILQDKMRAREAAAYGGAEPEVATTNQIEVPEKSKIDGAIHMEYTASDVQKMREVAHMVWINEQIVKGQDKPVADCKSLGQMVEAGAKNWLDGTRERAEPVITKLEVDDTPVEEI
jgi:hypothetical protein